MCWGGGSRIAGAARWGVGLYPNTQDGGGGGQGGVGRGSPGDQVGVFCSVCGIDGQPLIPWNWATQSKPDGELMSIKISVLYPKGLPDVFQCILRDALDSEGGGGRGGV